MVHVIHVSISECTGNNIRDLQVRSAENSEFGFGLKKQNKTQVTHLLVRLDNKISCGKNWFE